MSAWIAIVASAVSSYQAAEHQHLATLTPEDRVLWQARRAARRIEQEMEDFRMQVLSYLMEQRLAAERREAGRLARIDASEEVALAREMIQAEGLTGDHAETLLGFARELAGRREVTHG